MAGPLSDCRVSAAFVFADQDFAPEFAQSLSLADEVVLMNIYPAREKPIPNVSSNIIMDKITVPVRLMTESEIVEAAPVLKESR